MKIGYTEKNSNVIIQYTVVVYSMSPKNGHQTIGIFMDFLVIDDGSMDL